MSALKKIVLCVAIVTMCLFICVGYATVSSKLFIEGYAEATPVYPDVYITDITPKNSAGIAIRNTEGTVMFASVDGPGTATFTIDVINISGAIYVFDRVIDGAELNLEGIYSGTEITYTLSGIKRLDEITPGGGTLTFDVTINVPEGVTAENYILNFNFIDKRKRGRK